MRVGALTPEPTRGPVWTAAKEDSSWVGPLQTLHLSYHGGRLCPGSPASYAPSLLPGTRGRATTSAGAGPASTSAWDSGGLSG